jgi:hypothetical protein
MYSYHKTTNDPMIGDAIVILKWYTIPGAAVAGPYTKESTRPTKLKKDLETVAAFRFKSLKQKI